MDVWSRIMRKGREGCKWNARTTCYCSRNPKWCTLSHPGICSTPELYSLPKCVESTPPALYTQPLNVGNFNQAHPVDELWSSRESRRPWGISMQMSGSINSCTFSILYPTQPRSFGKVRTKKNILWEPRHKWLPLLPVIILAATYFNSISSPSTGWHWWRKFPKKSQKFCNTEESSSSGFR